MTQVKYAAFALMLALALWCVPQAGEAGQVSPGASTISTLQTEPQLTAGEVVDVNVWLMDAAGTLQDTVSMPVYVWVESHDRPGVMSPVLEGGREVLTWQATNGRIQKQPLRIWQAGWYSLHGSLTPPTAETVAAGTVAELSQIDTHYIEVLPGQAMPAYAYREVVMNGASVPDIIDVPLGGDGLSVTLKLTTNNRGPLAAGHTVTLTPSHAALQVSPTQLQTDSQGQVAFTLNGRSSGDVQLKITASGMERTITVRVGAAQTVYLMNQSTAVVNGQNVVLDALPRVINSRAYVPYRSLAEAFGGTVTYENGVITTNYNGNTVVMTVGSQHYSVNGTPMVMDASPWLDAGAGRTMIPVRFAAEGLGLRVVPRMDAAGATFSVTVSR